MAEDKKLFDDELGNAQIRQVEDLGALQEALAAEKTKSENYLANWQRVQADLVNYKKRAEQEKKESIEFADSLLILSLLTVLDDLERAFAALPMELAESKWTEGIKLVYDKLKGILDSRGLTEIKAKGARFDPYLHEAVMREEGRADIVIEEIQKGYKLKGRVVRPSMVTVGKGKETEQMSQEEE